MKYWLKNKDKTLLSFIYSQEFFEKIKIDKIEILSVENANLLPLELLGVLEFFNSKNKTQPSFQESNNKLLNWIKERKIPKNRAFFKEVMSLLEESNLMSYIDKTLGLSLNDSFWIVNEENKNLKWSEVNLYQNNFSEIVANLAFEGKTSSVLKNLKGLITSPEFTTNGMLKKCWHKIEGDIYLLKGQTEEYANSGKEAYSEYYAQQIAEVFKNHLKSFNFVKYDLMEFHQNLVSKCKIFTNENIGFLPIYKLLLNVKKPLNKKEKLTAIYEIYGKENFEDLMIFDAIIGNVDRHLGNFGLLMDNNTNKIIGNAPVFDNGLSLLNQLVKSEINDKDFLLNHFNKNLNALEISFEDVLCYFPEKRHLSILKELAEFKLEKHNSFNLNEEWLKGFEMCVKENAKLALLNLKLRMNKTNKLKM